MRKKTKKCNLNLPIRQDNMIYQFLIKRNIGQDKSKLQKQIRKLFSLIKAAISIKISNFLFVSVVLVYLVRYLKKDNFIELFYILFT